MARAPPTSVRAIMRKMGLYYSEGRSWHPVGIEVVTLDAWAQRTSSDADSPQNRRRILPLPTASRLREQPVTLGKSRLRPASSEAWNGQAGAPAARPRWRPGATVVDSRLHGIEQLRRRSGSDT